MKHLCLILFCFFSLSLVAQFEEDEKPPKKPFKDNVFFGGNIVLNFSSSGFILGGTPTVGYRITNKWSAGVGATALYSRFGFQGLRFDSFVYGGHVFTRYNVLETVFLQTEFQVVNTNAYNPLTGEDIGRKTVPMLYLGGGIRQPLGGRAYAMIFILYDVLDSPYSPFQNPFYRGGVVFGLR